MKNQIIKTLLIGSPFILGCQFSFAADISANSAIQAATLYPHGARISRTADFTATAGQHQIIIDDMPLHFDANSLRITGTGNVSYAILGTNHRIDHPTPIEQEDSPERKALKEQIDQLESDMRDQQDLRQAQQDIITAAAARLSYLEHLAEYEPNISVDNVANQRATPDTWRETAAVIGEETAIALTLQRKANFKINEINRRLTEMGKDLKILRQKYNFAPPPLPPVSRLSIEIETVSDTNGELSISYTTHQAAWAPKYVLKLDQENDVNNVTLERRAQIRQSTGENWQGVELTLSTAQPNQNIAMPNLREMRPIRFQSDQVRRFTKSYPSVVQGAQIEMEMDSMVQNMAAPAPKVAAQEIMIAPETKGQVVEFKIPRLIDLPGDGTIRQQIITTQMDETKLFARSVPKQDPTAYLYADWKNTSTAPVLAGNASVFNNGAYIGQIHLGFVAPQESKPLPFGPLEGIKITRIKELVKSGEVGLIGKDKIRKERYVITAENISSEDYDLKIYEHIPFSEEDDISVDMSAKPKPTDKSSDGYRGLVRWDFTLDSSDSKTIEYGYDIKWPDDKEVIINP